MPSPAAEVGRDEMGRANECIWPVGLSAVWDYSQLPWIRERWLLLQQGLTECAKHWEYITKQMGKIPALRSLWIRGGRDITNQFSEK